MRSEPQTSVRAAPLGSIQLAAPPFRYKKTDRTITSYSIAVAIGVTTFACVASAQDKSGVTPNTISRPSGPGSLEGLGDAFQPSLNTGTAHYAVTFSLPEGVAGFTPNLALRYDSGRGFSAAGIGWSFDPGSIRRQTDKGLPRYGATIAGESRPDRFLAPSGEELVPLANGYYLSKIASDYLRCRRVGDHWETRTKNGTKLEYGLTATGRVSDSTGTKVFRWCLERQTDTNGNVIAFEYVRPNEADRQVYLSRIRYGPAAPPWSHSYSVDIAYEDRPDPWTDYRSCFRVRTAKRVTQISVFFDATLIRRYVIGYGAHPHWSLLTSVTRLGDDGVSALPSTTFGYDALTLPDPSVPISALGQVITSTGNLFAAMDNAKVDLVDLNRDALPDLLVTDAGHGAYINRGVVEVTPGEWQVNWEGPVEVTKAELRTEAFELSSANVHLADMTGDGVADLVVTEPGSVEYFPNTGAVGWGTSEFMAIQATPPPAPFGVGGASVETTDLDFDKRSDIIKSDAGIYSIWYNEGGGQYSDEVVVGGAFHNGQFVDFADPGVELADMNGDRLNDVVKVTPISVVHFPNKGFGQFGASVEAFLPDRALDGSIGGNLERAKLVDINGDGLSDLVVERAMGNDLWLFLNLGDGVLAASRVITDLPTAATGELRWADINGNGTTDLIHADSSQFSSKINAVDIGVLLAGTPNTNALRSIDNGLGRRITLEYRSSTEFYLDAIAAGNPWTVSLPFPVSVVSSAITSTGLDLDGYPDEGPRGDEYVTDFVYRDGYYDPIEKQFRGFGFVKQIDRGDERFGGSLAPTLITRFRFHTGAPDGLDNDGDGLFDERHDWDGREEEPLKGLELWRETTSLPDDPLSDGAFAADGVVFERVTETWEVRDLSTPTAGSLPALLDPGYHAADDYGRLVRQAVNTRTETTIVERQINPLMHKRLESRSDLDPLGNTTFEWNLGDIGNANDDLYTGHEYARNEPAWIIDKVSRTLQRDGGPAGAFVSDRRNYYDGAPFVGLSLGQVGSRGLLVRTESRISDGAVPAITERSLRRGDPRNPTGRIAAERQAYDTFGNPVVILDANAGLTAGGQPDGAGHERRIAYDALLQKFPISETIVVGGGSPDLEVRSTFHYGFGTMLTVSDFNQNITRFEYDTFGRLSSEFRPGDDPLQPTKRYAYDWRAPFSANSTSTHTREGESPDVTVISYFDGLGRALGEFEVGGGVMNEVAQYNARGKQWKKHQPYFGSPVNAEMDWALPGVNSSVTVMLYDATGRTIETVTPEDRNGVVGRKRTMFLPLTTIESDAEDSAIGGPHFGTPKTLIYDGLKRLIEVREVEALSPADSGTFVTRYRYAMPDLLAETEDAKGNIKYMRYDGLGRKIFMNDCDRGHMTYTHDAASNLIRTVDAKNQRIDYTFDGVNRTLTEDYQDAGTPLSLDRMPDVAFHYDLPGVAHPELRNTRGQLAWVEDLSGAEYFGYDAREINDTRVKRIDQIDGATQDFTTKTLSDSLARIYQTVYPDGSVVRRSYDTRGLLAKIDGFIDALTYRASGQRSTCNFANGTTTTFDYDPRLRLTQLSTANSSEILQDLAYEFDQVDNVLRISDGRAISNSDPRNQTADFVFDDCYRLQQAIGAGYGTIDYDYDRLGNMISKTSPNIADPNVNRGAMTSGGAMGTSGRIGREAGQSAGPHALTLTDDSVVQQSIQYDANGNQSATVVAQYAYDFKDRLGTVTTGGKNIRYLYDHADRRVIKRVDGVQTSYVNEMSEVRGGQAINYVFADETRVARIDGTLAPPPIITQRISLVPGWNLFSFQVLPLSADPATLLASLDGKFTGVFGHVGTTYASRLPFLGGGSLITLLPNTGYWIFMTESAELIVEGALSENAVDVPAGGNVLVGFPGLTPRSSDTIASGLSALNSLATFHGEPDGWRVFAAGGPGYINSLTATVPGQGYWVAANATTSLALQPTVSSATVYYHPDRLGSTNLLTDEAGQLVSATVYYPYGEPRHEVSFGTSGTDPQYRYGDKERDQETGLQYFEARFYDASLGRFTRVDRLYTEDSARALADPQRFNIYAYAFNNPVNYRDPTGLEGLLASVFGQANVDKAMKVASDTANTIGVGSGTIEMIGKAGANLSKLGPVKATVGILGKVAGVAGVGVGALNMIEGVQDNDTGKAFQGVTDAGASLYGLVGGVQGLVFSTAYAGGSILAPVIDDNTGWYDGAVKDGNDTKEALKMMGAGDTLSDVGGMAMSAVQSINPVRLLFD